MTFRELVILMQVEVINPAVVLITGLATLYFVYGVSKYVLHGGDEAKRTEGYNMMIHGVVALFVMFSFWGFVKVLTLTIFSQAVDPNNIVPGILGPS